MRVLVCGGRNWGPLEDTEKALDLLPFKPSLVIHGGASGADIQAGEWARMRGIHVAEVKALWDHYGKAAGFKRNYAMLSLQPQYCVAFPGGKGTAIMVNLCRQHNITVWQPYDQ